MNDTIKSIMDRRSIRAYTDAPLSDEQITALKECALASPTAMNAQSWHFSFVTDRSAINSVENAVVDIIMRSDNEPMKERIKSRSNKIFYDAPLAVFISADRSSRWGAVDAGIAVQNLALAAHSMGLGSVIIGMCAMAFENDADRVLSKKLGFPEGHDFAIAIAIGHPAAGKDAHPVQEGKITDIN